ncbi:MAG: UrcA family protein [Sphingomicrobium sp.]
MSVQSRIASTAAALAALAFTLALAPSSASAQEGPVTIYGEALNANTELVSFARLDLAKASDQRRLNRRVASAVERVCLRDIGRDGLQDRGYYACHGKAWDDAAPQIALAVAQSNNLALGGAAPFAVTAIRISAR